MISNEKDKGHLVIAFKYSKKDTSERKDCMAVIRCKDDADDNVSSWMASKRAIVR